MITKPKGTEDILPGEVREWVKLEEFIRRVASLYNFKEIRTPIFESGELFHRNQEDSSDMVTKETYDFLDKGGRSLTLRPEGTAPAVRALIENKIYVENPVAKLFYINETFRYERPQKGRQRQFHQFGIEAYGSNDPLLDVECISLACTLLKGLGLKNVRIRLNTLGDETSRNNYRDALINYFTSYQDDLCSDCKERLKKNPLRILDCKVDSKKDYFKNAPKISDYLTEESKAHFNQVIEGLEALGLSYEVDDSLVRGLDYYTYTVFEIEYNSDALGSQNVICGGGRYNNLIKELGGPDLPAVGLAFGMERLLLAIRQEGIKICPDEKIHLYIIALGSKAHSLASKLVNQYRMQGLSSDIDYLSGSLKAQFKKADKNNALFTAILGDTEVESNTINIKNNQTNIQETISIDDLYTYIVKSINQNSHCSNCKKA